MAQLGLKVAISNRTPAGALDPQDGLSVAQAKQILVQAQRLDMLSFLDLVPAQSALLEGLLRGGILDQLRVEAASRKLREELGSSFLDGRRQLGFVPGEEQKRCRRGPLLALEEQWRPRAEQQERGHRSVLRGFTRRRREGRRN